MGPIWIANVAVISVSFIIFVLITASYARSLRELRSKAFLEIMTFSSLFMVQSLVSVVVYYVLSLRYDSYIATLLLAINSIGLIAYIFLFKSVHV